MEIRKSGLITGISVNGIFCIKCGKAYFNARASCALKYVSFVILTIYFVRCIPKVSQAGVVLRAESSFSVHLKFHRTSPGKSTFRTQNDTDSANFRYTANEKYHYRTWYERYFLFAVYRKLAKSVSFCVRKVNFPRT